jgi:hypothetical protein
MTTSVVRRLFQKKCRIIALELWPGGPPLIDAILHKQGDDLGKKYGVDYVNLGYKSGNEVVMLSFGNSFSNTFPGDYSGTPVKTMPLMRESDNFRERRAVNISAGTPGTKEWVQQAGPLHYQDGVGRTAVQSPEIYPYPQRARSWACSAAWRARRNTRSTASRSGNQGHGRPVERARVHHVLILLGNVIYSAPGAALEGRVGFHPAPFWPDPGVWIAALLTLFIFSFLYKDNPFYKFAEHLFVGVSAGYFVVQQFWQVIVPNLIDPVMDPAKPHRWTYFVAAMLCLMLFTRLFAKASWLSRFAIAVIIGVYAGAKTTGFAQAEVVAQTQATMLPLWNAAHIVGLINNIVLGIGVCARSCSSLPRPSTRARSATAKLGIWYLMVSFGAAYGFTVMCVFRCHRPLPVPARSMARRSLRARPCPRSFPGPPSRGLLRARPFDDTPRPGAG